MSVASLLRQPTVTTSPAGQLLGTVHRARWFLVGLHLPFVTVPAVITISAGEDPPAVAR